MYIPDFKECMLGIKGVILEINGIFYIYKGGILEKYNICVTLEY